MSITSLPEATVRLLGCTQVLTTPTSLIKELIDNSLDAQATSVDIYLSQNTLDRVEVRDNGHGIPREEFDALGKRGFTSKLRSFDELKSIGGTSLGFRGEALFSAVQLGKVSITSKSDGEQIATMAKFKVGGGIETQTTASHPTGTTVCIADFLHSIPVRKQTCLKEAPKTLGKIRELLRAYSLARPHVKFSLKSAKNSKGTWSYSPRLNTGIREAVLLAIGRDVASQCMEKSIVFQEIKYRYNNKNDSPLDDATSLPSTNINQFTIDMFVPKPDADFSKISHGQYISVDARPVSHDKGTMKKITTIFKHYVRNILPETSYKILNPFLRLNIKCPVESYDPNVEPAKDDVIFINEDLILENIEKLFIDIYGKNQSLKEVSKTTNDSTPDDFEPLLSRELSADSHAINPQSITANDSQISSDEQPKVFNIMPPLTESSIIGGKEYLRSQEARKTKIIDMSEDLTELVKTPVKRVTQKNQNLFTPESITDINEINSTSLNPWTIAKSSLSKQKIEKPRNYQSPRARVRCGLPLTPHSSSDPTMEESEIIARVEGLSQKEGDIENDIDRGSFMQNMGNNPADIRNDQSSKPLISNQIPAIDSEDELFVSEKTTTPSHCRDFVSARHLIDSHELPINSLALSEQYKNSANIFKSPLKKRQKKCPEILNNTLITDKNVSRRRYENIEQSKEIQDLTWSMDYEQRKEQATKQFREEMRLSKPNRLSPHQNRYNAATLALDDNIHFEQQKIQNPISLPKVKTSIPDDDPRGYFIRRQNSFLHHTGEKNNLKISRAKYLRLPLERIPLGQETHKHLFKLSTDTKKIKEKIELFEVSDECFQKGSDENVFTKSLLNLNEKDKDTMISAIKYMVEEWKGNFTATDKYEIDYDFDNLIVSDLKDAP